MSANPHEKRLGQPISFSAAARHTSRHHLPFADVGVPMPSLHPKKMTPAIIALVSTLTTFSLSLFLDQIISLSRHYGQIGDGKTTISIYPYHRFFGSSGLERRRRTNSPIERRATFQRCQPDQRSPGRPHGWRSRRKTTPQQLTPNLEREKARTPAFLSLKSTPAHAAEIIVRGGFNSRISVISCLRWPRGEEYRRAIIQFPSYGKISWRKPLISHM